VDGGGLLWILDASINVSMEPFRAFVADKLPEAQRGMGFAMQSFFIGVGAVVAGMLPYILKNWFHVSSETGAGNVIPLNVKISFYAGAAAFLGRGAVDDFFHGRISAGKSGIFRRKKSEKRRPGPFCGRDFQRPARDARHHEAAGLVQFFTWLGIVLHVAAFLQRRAGRFWHERQGFGIVQTRRGMGRGLLCGQGRGDVCGGLRADGGFAQHGAQAHSRNLPDAGRDRPAGGGLHSRRGTKGWLLLALALGGVAWASILSMPYAILAGALPAERMGVYMGIFNFFIVLPEIIAALTFGPW
jgi:maltose/moltooligosaccharide transporter